MRTTVVNYWISREITRLGIYFFHSKPEMVMSIPVLLIDFSGINSLLKVVKTHCLMVYCDVILILVL